ncbi:hypothetical protein FQZ97_1090740 [compost metagenome]
MVPSGSRSAHFLLAALLRLVAFAFRFQVDTHERRTDQGQHDGRSDRAENIGDRIGDRHRIQQPLGLFRCQTETIDRVRSQSHRRGNGLGSGIEPERRADIVAGYLGGDIGGTEAKDADNRCE